MIDTWWSSNAAFDADDDYDGHDDDYYDDHDISDDDENLSPCL